MFIVHLLDRLDLLYYLVIWQLSISLRQAVTMPWGKSRRERERD